MAIVSNHYKIVRVAENMLNERVRLITAKNSNAYTNFGTNTYLIGTQNLAIIDPGPNLTSHFENVLNTIGSAKLTHIFLTHSHQDHCAMAIRLAYETGSKIYLLADPNLSKIDLLNKIKDKSDKDQKFCNKIFNVQVQTIKDFEQISNEEWCLKVIATPGHMDDHICLALHGSDAIFSGDHVMGWSSTVIIPPMGNMSHFILSLEKLLERDENLYLPGHGDLIPNAKDYVKSQLNHRKNRELQIFDLIKSRPFTSKDLINIIYPDINSELREAAESNIFAHLIDLASKTKISNKGKMSIKSKFFYKL